ncbi:hypothetical protein [Schumannella sp. 10F1B-5-1]|uniref:hypothetical protein n=1 Tax=Schumannella sp. 10F1B-5-1 TaxID=2590780 RepID=UPI0011325B71|nr:hypothetical protein [Schumannella sp. 10F1B-5-1]TPW78417.1 hypothetical protein FJ658_01020 [Schumannella sp. 10F1B-5-1]
MTTSLSTSSTTTEREHRAQTTAHPPQQTAHDSAQHTTPAAVPADRHHAQRPTLSAPELRRHRGLADRLALRLGLALITWSRRPLVLSDRTPWRNNPLELRRAQLQRQEADRLRYALHTR